MVRVGTPSAVARPDWYDRNPAITVDHYEGVNVAPHVATSRISYTCPAGKKAMVEVLQARAERTTAATTLGIVNAYYEFTPSGGAAKYLLSSRFENNAVGTLRETSLATTLILLAGDKVEGKTIDSSTGGTCYYHLSYKITVFDA